MEIQCHAPPRHVAAGMCEERSCSPEELLACLKEEETTWAKVLVYYSMSSWFLVERARLCSCKGEAGKIRLQARWGKRRLSQQAEPGTTGGPCQPVAVQKAPLTKLLGAGSHRQQPCANHSKVLSWWGQTFHKAFLQGACLCVRVRATYSLNASPGRRDMRRESSWSQPSRLKSTPSTKEVRNCGEKVKVCRNNKFVNKEVSFLLESPHKCKV